VLFGCVVLELKLQRLWVYCKGSGSISEFPTKPQIFPYRYSLLHPLITGSHLGFYVFWGQYGSHAKKIARLGHHLTKKNSWQFL